MSANETALLDPFDVSTPDEATELTAIARALELAEGFRLIFVRCNQIPQRERLIEEVRARLPKLNIRTLFFREPISHLLDAVQMQLTLPLPDAVFVSGLEFSLPVAAEAQATPLIANLNASRNSFAQTLPCPVVLWVPEYVLTAIMQGAPDFFSIRSGVYFFAAKREELIHFTQEVPKDLSGKGLWEFFNLTQQEKQDRIASIARLLEDYEFLPEKRDDDLVNEVSLLHTLGHLFRYQGNSKKAIASWEKALKILENQAGKEGFSGIEGAIEITLHNIGLTQQEMGNYEVALDYYQRSLKIAEDRDKAAAIRLLLECGRMEEVRGNYEAALNYYERSLKIREDLDDKWGVANSLYRIGAVNQAVGNYEAALDCYQRSYKIYEDLKNRAWEVKVLIGIGDVHQARGNYEAALNYYERSLKLNEDLRYIEKWDVDIAILTAIGDVYQAHENYEAALNYYERSLKINEELDDKRGVANSLLRMGAVNQTAGNYKAASDCYQRSYKMYEDLGDKEGIARMCWIIGGLEMDTGQFANAFIGWLVALSNFAELNSPKTYDVVNGLKYLRRKWDGFDAAWRQYCSKDVPEWFLQDEETNA